MLSFSSPAAAQNSIDRNIVGEASKKAGITYRIDASSAQRKGVIYDWLIDDTIEELINMMDDTSNVIQIERMIKTYFLKEEKKRLWKKCSGVLITFDGSNLPKGIQLYKEI